MKIPSDQKVAAGILTIIFLASAACAITGNIAGVLGIGLALILVSNKRK